MQVSFFYSKNGLLLSYLLAIAISIFPIYVFQSGGVQPAHVIFLLFSFVFLLRFGFFCRGWVVCFIFFVFYVFFVESVYVSLGAHIVSLMNALYFLFNFIIVVSVYGFCFRRGPIGLKSGLLIAVGIEVVSVALSSVSLLDASSGRSVGTFNNPNQLGYFSVCVLSFSYLLYLHNKISYLLFLFFLFSSVFLSIASLSKAAMLANFFVVAFVLRPVNPGSSANYLMWKIYSIMFWVFLLFGMTALFYWAYLSGYWDMLVFVKRISELGTESDSSLSSRGYFAFLDGNFFQIIFGLGEGYVQEIVGHEVHSTMASVFNKYGVFGFVVFLCIFLFWLVKLFRVYGFGKACCLGGPILLYGITHNGTRFTIFWVLFAASLAMADRALKDNMNNC